jgi:hypothetical protein
VQSDRRGHPSVEIISSQYDRETQGSHRRQRTDRGQTENRQRRQREREGERGRGKERGRERGREREDGK